MSWVNNISKRNRYYEETAVESASDLILRALKYGNFENALDLGCGAGVDTKVIAKNGAKVTAVDINSEVKKYFGKADKNIELVIKSFSDFKFAKYDLIYAKSSIVFLKPDGFYEIIEKIKNALNPDGIFAVRLWGKNDSDNIPSNSNAIYFSRREIEKLFNDFEILEIKEKEKDSKNAEGRLKHWHFWDVIIKKSKPNRYGN